MYGAGFFAFFPCLQNKLADSHQPQVEAMYMFYLRTKFANQRSVLRQEGCHLSQSLLAARNKFPVVTKLKRKLIVISYRASHVQLHCIIMSRNSLHPSSSFILSPSSSSAINFLIKSSTVQQHCRSVTGDELKISSTQVLPLKIKTTTLVHS